MKTLIFEGAGWSSADSSKASDVGNCRIRATFLNKQGKQIYIELNGTIPHKWSPQYMKGFKVGALLDNYDYEIAMHDFWLTRNRHGAGFWDGDYEKADGEKLTELAHSFGEINLYVGDDGKIYM